MNRFPAHNTSALLGDDAIVIGGSVGGLLAARSLAAHFERVTILERDPLPGPGEFRPGTPQARHAHTLLPEGQALFELLFPGFTDELLAGGAVSLDPAQDISIFMEGSWRAPKNRDAGRRVTFSRPFFEAVLRQRLADYHNVVFLASQEVMGLSTDAGRTRVTGVRLRRRRLLGDGVEALPADLVVDASGRNSQAPRWLADLGYTPPGETLLTTHTGYATRLYRRPSNFDAGWKMLYLRPRPPAGTRGGLILPVEGDRWLVTLIGVARDYPSTDVDGFENFARQFPTPRFYEALQKAEPLDEPFGFQQTETRLRHFDHLPRWLGNFLVLGDAVMTLNPVYALGMTAAALGSLTLEECLRVQHASRPSAHELARRFQTQLAEVTARLWLKVTQEDRSWPMLEVHTMGEVPSLHGSELQSSRQLAGVAA